MQVSPAALEEFIALYYDIFGEELTAREASAIASRLLAFYETASQWPTTPQAADADPARPAKP
jgi:hypothetical protein